MHDVEFILANLKELANITQDNALTVAAIVEKIADQDKELHAIRGRLTLIERDWE